MVKAVISGGAIKALEPLPGDWREGQPLLVEKLEENENSADIDQAFNLLAALCQANDPADEERLDSALDEARRQAKDQVRRQMGLP